ncbi:hypothetical protein Gpo141_00008502 [Globisporangium polare]
MDTKERKRQHRWEQKNRWMGHYELKYGVTPIEFAHSSNSATNGSGATTADPAAAALTLDGAPVVLKAKCRFCESFGRETGGHGGPPARKGRGGAGNTNAGSSAPEDEDAGLHAGSSDFAASADLSGLVGDVGIGVQPPSNKRRKKRQTLKVFGPNFRTDNLESHLSREHPIRWREYERLRDVEKKEYFPDVPVFKEFLMATGAAGAGTSPAVSVGHHHLQAQAALLSATASPVKLQGVHHTTTANAMAAAAAVVTGSSSSNSSAAMTSSLSGFSPSGFLGGKMLGFSDKPLGPQSMRYLVPVSVMEMVDELLSSRAVTSESSGTSSWWHQFVRLDDSVDESTLSAPVDLKSVAATGSDTFTLTIKNEPLFSFIADALGNGVSLDAALSMVHSAQRFVLDPLVFGNVTPCDIVDSVRSLVGVNLSAISMLMAFTWGYSVLLRFVTRYSTGYLDIRVQLAVHDEIHDLHVLAVPIDAQKHSPETVSAVVIKALSAVDPRAVEKIIGVTVDGDPYHMQKYKHVASLLHQEVAAATNNSAFYVLHSGAYHINMVVEELLEICQEEFGILATLADLEALCTANVSLYDEMGGPEASSSSSGPGSVPRVASAHWIEVYTLCEWLAMHRETVTKWCQDHNELHRVPANTSWVIVFLLRDILKDVHAAYVKCVDQSTSFSDIQRHLRELIFQFRLKFNVKAVGSTATGASSVGEPQAPTSPGAVTGAQPVGEDVGVPVPGAVAAGEDESVVAPQSFLDLSEFSYQDFVNAIIPLDLFMYEAFQLKSIDGVGEHERQHVHERFNALILLLISKFQGLASVSAESSSSAPGSETSPAGSPFPEFHQYNADIPPSTPYELIMMNNLAFMGLLNSQQFRIRAKWTGKVLAMITEERNRMITDFSMRGAFYDAVSLTAKQQQQGSFVFRDAWKIASLVFGSLSSFAITFGCLLSVAKSDDMRVTTNASLVGSRFERAQPQLLSNVMLEGQLHARQFDKINALRKHINTVV